ncbi:MAG TPA: hypothetical protein VFG06_06050 [Thermodesulfovibrionales bacterium]|nr:hypothetical protein [Thermodesulfovibrionales bacterium]
MNNKMPIPIIKLASFQGGRFFRNRYVYGLDIKFPCIPAWFTRDLSEKGYDRLTEVLHSFDICWYTAGIGGRPKNIEISDAIIRRLFGHTTLQAFYRRAKAKNRCVYKNKRTMWCLPSDDLRNVVYRYRANVWNQSEHVPKEYQGLFQPLWEQLQKWMDDPEKNWFDFHPNYSVFDLGENRKPILYTCNLCGFSGEEKAWRWGSPTPGLYSHEIIDCPECGARKGDIFGKVMAAEEGKKYFSPTGKYQDDHFFTL